MAKNNNKIPVVANMDPNGQIQCPSCFGFFYPKHGEVYKVGLLNCPYCKKEMKLEHFTVQTGNQILSSPRTINGAARAKRFVAQSSVTKGLNARKKEILVRGIASLVNDAFKKGIVQGKRQSELRSESFLNRD